MKKFFVFLGLILNFAVMVGSIFFLIDRLKGGQISSPSKSIATLPKRREPPPSENISTPSLSSSTVNTGAASKPMEAGEEASSLQKKPAPAPLSAPALSSTEGHEASRNRKILFSFNNAKARLVMIRADFTGWKAEPMQKEGKQLWTYTATLTPGDYGYLFAVDGKAIRDPANKKTKKIGTNLVSLKTVTL